ncbi:MAG: hypothetical protein ACI4V4_05295 [Eubacterium sp.]
MKDLYESPVAEMVTFKYQEMVTTSSGSCGSQWINIGGSDCMDSEIVHNFA